MYRIPCYFESLSYTHLSDLPKDLIPFIQTWAWDRVFRISLGISPSSQTTVISPGVVQPPGMFCKSHLIITEKSRFNTLLN